MSYLNKVPAEMSDMLEKEGVAWCYPRKGKALTDKAARDSFKDTILKAAPHPNEVPKIVWNVFYGNVAGPESIVLNGWVNNVDEEVLNNLLDKTNAINTMDNDKSIFESQREIVYRYKEGEDYFAFMQMIANHYDRYGDDNDQTPAEARSYNPEENVINLNNLNSSVSHAALTHNLKE
ncbi:MAG: hypothetical protein R3Y43_07905 [Alphaproteobacteria bacterium]